MAFLAYSVGILETLVVLVTGLFWFAPFAGIVWLLFRGSRSERTIATSVKENRRLREEIAQLKGEKP